MLGELCSQKFRRDRVGDIEPGFSQPESVFVNPNQTIVRQGREGNRKKGSGITTGAAGEVAEMHAARQTKLQVGQFSGPAGEGKSFDLNRWHWVWGCDLLF